jgi:hypothetical protein
MQDLIVIGDSSLIIIHMKNPSIVVYIISRIHQEEKKIESDEYKNMSRAWNQQLDHLANEASHLEEGKLIIKAGVLDNIIP